MRLPPRYREAKSSVGWSELRLDPATALKTGYMVVTLVERREGIVLVGQKSNAMNAIY